MESADEARALVRRLEPQVTFYKVGMELYAAAGIAFVRELVDQGLDVFLDLKFYDIPETVRRAVAQVARTGVRFLTVHAVPSVMRAAVEGKGDSSLQLLGVTVLTSFGREDLADLGYTCERLGTGRDPGAARRWTRGSTASSRRRWRSPRCGGSRVRARFW